MAKKRHPRRLRDLALLIVFAVVGVRLLPALLMITARGASVLVRLGWVSVVVIGLGWWMNASRIAGQRRAP